MSAIKRASDILGSQRALAEKLGITPGAVSQWAKGRVPLEHCIVIEEITGGAVTCEDLRPDVNWAHLRRPSGDDKASPATTAAPEKEAA